MRLIIIEDTVYKVSERIYKLIQRKNEEVYGEPYYPGRDLKMSDFIESTRDKFKLVGTVDYDFRL